MSKKIIPPQAQAQAFLNMLDPEASSFCFRKLPDNKTTRVRPDNLDGKFREILPELRQANRAGGGELLPNSWTDFRFV